MELDQLRTFLAVLQHSSFSRAAEALHLAQSTVSFHIKALESGVGTRLLDRNGGKVRPTSSGRVLRRYAERILALRDEALDRLQEDQAGESGSITLAASTIPAEFILPPLLARFRRTRPRVRLTVLVGDSHQATAMLLAEECDLAVVGARPTDKRLLSDAFAEDEIVLVGPSPNPFAPDDRLSADGLAATPLVLREPGSGTRNAVAQLIAAAQPTGGPAPLEVGSTEAARRCVLEGLGLAFLSRRAVEEDLRAGRMRLVDTPGLPVQRRFWVVRARTQTPSAAAEALLELLMEGA